jgi:hypothetical protein
MPREKDQMNNIQVRTWVAEKLPEKGGLPLGWYKSARAMQWGFTLTRELGGPTNPPDAYHALHALLPME